MKKQSPHSRLLTTVSKIQTRHMTLMTEMFLTCLPSLSRPPATSGKRLQEAWPGRAATCCSHWALQALTSGTAGRQPVGARPGLLDQIGGEGVGVGGRSSLRTPRCVLPDGWKKAGSPGAISPPLAQSSPQNNVLKACKVIGLQSKPILLKYGYESSDYKASA